MKTNLEHLTYDEIPSLIKEGGHNWSLFSGSACPKVWCQRQIEDFPDFGNRPSPPKEKVMKKIKDGYVVYIHW